MNSKRSTVAGARQPGKALPQIAQRLKLGPGALPGQLRSTPSIGSAALFPQPAANAAELQGPRMEMPSPLGSLDLSDATPSVSSGSKGNTTAGDGGDGAESAAEPGTTPHCVVATPQQLQQQCVLPACTDVVS